MPSTDATRTAPSRAPGPLTRTAARAAGGLFGGLAGLLHGRPLHPSGIAFEAGFTVPEAIDPQIALFARPGAYAAAVRFSRGFGLPEPLPEILSVAVKVRDAYGPGDDQDFLLTASGRAVGLRHTFAWGRSHLAHHYSSVIPFRAGGRQVLFGARPLTSPQAGARDLTELEDAAAAGRLALELQIASLLGPWRAVAVLESFAPLPPAAARALRFSSDTTGGGIQADDPVNRIRGAAYRAANRRRQEG